MELPISGVRRGRVGQWLGGFLVFVFVFFFLKTKRVKEWGMIRCFSNIYFFVFFFSMLICQPLIGGQKGLGNFLVDAKGVKLLYQDKACISWIWDSSLDEQRHSNQLPVNRWINNQTISHKSSPYSSTKTAIEEKISSTLLSNMAEQTQTMAEQTPIHTSFLW